MKMEGVGMCEIVPEPFEFESAVEVSVCPEERDHLSEEYEAGGFAFGGELDGGESVTHECIEQPGIGSAVDHEDGQSFGGVECVISS
jgi:hypothetical protein